MEIFVNTDGQTVIEVTEKHLEVAINEIDSQFGKGYAKEHPELVATYLTNLAYNLKTAAMVQQSANLKDALNDLGHTIESGLSQIADSI